MIGGSKEDDFKMVKVCGPHLDYFLDHACLNLSGMWLGVDLRMDIKKDRCSIRIGSCAQKLLIIMG
jgi:hypothetical protein